MGEVLSKAITLRVRRQFGSGRPILSDTNAPKAEIIKMSNGQSSEKLRSDGKVTRDRIVLAAEKLFSIDGYSGVSLRQITGEAGVDLALIKYYFGSKAGLFNEVLSRRVEKMSLQRLQDLAAIKIVENSDDTVRELLTTFLSPMLGNSPHEMDNLRNYRLLIALVTNSRTWQDEVFKQHYDPTAVEFIKALTKALPKVNWADICWAFSFFLGSVVNAFAETGRIDRLSNGKCRSSDLQEACRQLITYSVGAFMALPRAPGTDRITNP